MKSFLFFLQLWGVPVVLVAQPSGDQWVAFFRGRPPNDALWEDLSAAWKGQEEDRDGDWAIEFPYGGSDEQLEDDNSFENPLLIALGRLVDRIERNPFDPDHLISERARTVLNDGGIDVPVNAISYREFVLLEEDQEYLLGVLRRLEKEEKYKKGKRPIEEEDDCSEESEVQEVTASEFMNTLMPFPDEMWLEVLSFLDVRDWVNFSEVCRSAYRLAHDAYLLGAANARFPEALRDLHQRFLWAVSHDKLGMIKYEIGRSDIRLVNYFVNAVRSSAYDTVRYMLAQGMRLSDMLKGAREASEHPYRVLANTSPEIRELLLKHERMSVWHQGLLNSRVESVTEGDGLNDEDPYLGYAPIHLAVLLGDLMGLSHLSRQEGVELGVLDREGLSVLHLAVQTHSLDCVQFVVEQGGVDSNVLGGRSRETALHMALRLGYYEIVEFLLSLDDIDPNVLDNDGNAPIHVAIRFGRDELLPYFRNAPHTNWNQHNSRGDGPAHQAIRERDINVLLFLLELEEGLVDWGLPNDLQHTPGSLAAAIGDWAALKLLSESQKVDIEVYMPVEGDVEVGEGPAQHRESRLRRAVKRLKRLLPRF